MTYFKFDEQIEGMHLIKLASGQCGGKGALDDPALLRAAGLCASVKFCSPSFGGWHGFPAANASVVVVEDAVGGSPCVPPSCDDSRYVVRVRPPHLNEDRAEYGKALAAVINVLERPYQWVDEHKWRLAPLRAALLQKTLSSHPTAAVINPRVESERRRRKGTRARSTAFVSLGG